MGNGGRIDFLSGTYPNANNDDEAGALEKYFADIIITPPQGPRDTYRNPQTTFRLARETTQYSSTLLTPIISFRRTRCHRDEIFEVAKWGTSQELQMILCRGEASLSDCDEEGRSLLNYALRGQNTSTTKYLLTKVDDVNTYEPNMFGQSRPLIKFVPRYIWFSTRSSSQLECINLMLEFGADLSLPCYPTPVSDKVFENWLKFEPVEIVKLMLDKGGPTISIGEDSDSQGALLSLIRNKGYLGIKGMAFDANEKIHLLLQRGVSVGSCNEYRQNPLHLLFETLRDDIFRIDLDRFKDAIMCIVTAGADVTSCDAHGLFVSQYACEGGYEALWIEALAECGYDPEPALRCLEEYYHRQNDGFGVLIFDCPTVRSTKLSFAEYSKQRRPLGICTESESVPRILRALRDAGELGKVVELTREGSNNDEGWNLYCDGEIFSTEHVIDWWLQCHFLIPDYSGHD